MLNEILCDNEEFRIDDGYYKKEYIEIYKKLVKSTTLGEECLMSDVSSNGCFAYVQKTLNDECPKTVPYIRSGNVGNTFVCKDDLICISEQAHKKLTLSVTKLNDVIMARKGKIGGASIITEKEVNFNCNENVIKLTIKHPDKLNPYYFTTFFNTYFGLKQIERLSTGNVQPWVSIYQIKKLKCVVLDRSFQQEIASIVQQAHAKLEESKSLYQQAKTLLNNELNINIQNDKTPNVNIKTFSQSLSMSGRLDAEYYQDKYDLLFDCLSRLETKTLGELVNIEKSIEPGSDAYLSEGIPFYRISDLSVNGFSDTDIFLNKDMFASALRIKKDTIMFSKDGSIGIAYKADQDIDGITSGAILHLQVTDSDVLPDYLTLVLNSQVVKLQSERDAGGSIIKHWKPDEISQVIIPILPQAIQHQISTLVQKSFVLKSESKQLLEEAKTMVEREIEK